MPISSEVSHSIMGEHTHSPSSGPWGLLRPVRKSRHPSPSEADAAAAPHICHLSLFLSFSTVLLYVSLGRPHLLLPSGAHVNAVLEMLSGHFLSKCPNHRHLLTRIRTDTDVLPVALHSSSLLRWLVQNLLSSLLRHVRWSTPVCRDQLLSPSTFHFIQQHREDVRVQGGQLGLLAESTWTPDVLKSGECSSR